MKKFFTTSIGRLRLYAFLEGISLLVLVFIAVPLKYAWQNPSLVKALGPVHGALFLLFVINALREGVEQRLVAPVRHQCADPLLPRIAFDTDFGSFGAKEIGPPPIEVPGREDVMIEALDIQRREVDGLRTDIRV